MIMINAIDRPSKQAFAELVKIFMLVMSIRHYNMHSYKSVCPTVRPSVGPYVCHAFAFWPSRSDICRVHGLVFNQPVNE